MIFYKTMNIAPFKCYTHICQYSNYTFVDIIIIARQLLDTGAICAHAKRKHTSVAILLQLFIGKLNLCPCDTNIFINSKMECCDIFSSHFFTMKLLWKF